MTFFAGPQRLSVSGVCQQKDNTPPPSWFGRGCWCIDSYLLLIYESCINGWDSHDLHACLLSPTSAGKISTQHTMLCLFLSDKHTSHLFISQSCFFLSYPGSPCHSISYAAEFKSKVLSLSVYASFSSSNPTSPPFLAQESSQATCYSSRNPAVPLQGLDA